MATTIKLKNSVTTTNAPSSLAQGEVAINITDKKVWVGNAATTPIQLLGDGGSVNFTTVDTTNLQVTNIKAKDGTASASIANSTGAFTVAAAFAANGGATLGDASGDALTINSSAVSIPNGLNFDSNTLVIDAANNRVGVNNATPTTALDVTGTATISTNLAFTGTGNRITGDFSTAPPNLTNRVMIQSSTTNGQTGVIAIPNGTSTAVQFEANSDSAGGTNGSTAVLAMVGGSEVRLAAGIRGTGTYLPMTFYTNNIERLRIDTSGNVGIGTSSPSYKLHVVGTGTTAQARVESTSTANGQISFINTSTSSTGFVVGLMNDTSGDALIYHQDAKNIRFYTSSTERMRITSGGSVVMGGTAAPTIGGVGAQHGAYGPAGTGSWALGLQQDTTSASGGRILALRNVTDFNNTGNEVIYYTGNTTARFYVVSNGGIYNYQANDSNLSDRREKTNIKPAGEYLSKICAIPVQTFNYIDQNMEDDDGTTLGVIAQDVQAVAPELVTENNWGTQEEPKMRLSIYQTDLQYALMKCIQEQQAMIEELKQEVAKLKGV